MQNGKLRRFRLEQGMTQSELAAKLGVSPSAVGMYEQGRRQPDGRLLARMASVLHCSTDELLEADQPHEVNEVIDRFARTLERQPGLMYHGAPLTKSDREKLVSAIRIAAAISSGKEQAR
jgi:transcriptional regulator with XRE-family HTH domain